MSDSLNVVALISGGKDSIYSITHCLQNGHRIVALANLYPSPVQTSGANEAHDLDLNSFMYQSVGHTVVPLYEAALGIPLYRQPITGTAVRTELTYQPSADGIDETESLVPLLQSVISKHPEINAVSTGAILSTYQRTRVESVALRLGLIPLSFLWKYPALPPGTQTSLLEDLRNAGLDARIIKVASGGLDESFLWENVASTRGMSRIARAVARFGADGDGAALGEGGEFETLVIDGPSWLFKGRIIVPEKEQKIIREEGGSAWLKIGKATIEVKRENESHDTPNVRIPDHFDEQFSAALDSLLSGNFDIDTSKTSGNELQDEKRNPKSTEFSRQASTDCSSDHTWTLVSRAPQSSIELEIEDIVSQLRSIFEEERITLGDVLSTVILLREMKDFGRVNSIYGAFFKEVNPPARVTVACGDSLPQNCNIIVHLNLIGVSGSKHLRKSLHVQSRSYWAPANIGPYSQAQSFPPFANGQPLDTVSKVWIAGQIPLIPATMSLPVHILPLTHGQINSKPRGNDTELFSQQVVLSLQHLWRIGFAMCVSWWTSATAYLSRDTIGNVREKARIAGAAWDHLHLQKERSDDDEDDVERDLWEEQYHRGVEARFEAGPLPQLPDWSQIKINPQNKDNTSYTPPFFAAEVEELPRQSLVEWHSHLGITAGPITIFSFSQPGKGRLDGAVLKGNELYSLVMIRYQNDLQHREIKATIDAFDLQAKENLGAGLGFSNGFLGSYASYLDAYIPGLWSAPGTAGVIPCHSLWSKDGERLAAVLLFRSRVPD